MNDRFGFTLAGTLDLRGFNHNSQPLAQSLPPR